MKTLKTVIAVLLFSCFIFGCSDGKVIPPVDLDLASLTGVAPPKNCRIDFVIYNPHTTMSSDSTSVYLVENCRAYLKDLASREIWPGFVWEEMSLLDDEDAEFLENNFFRKIERETGGVIAKPYEDGVLLLDARHDRRRMDHGRLLFIDKTFSSMMVCFW